MSGIEGVGDFRSASTAEFRDALVAWIEERRSELAPPYHDHGSTEELLSHQRRVQRLLFDHGFMRWGWPTEVGGLGGNPLFRAVLGEELTGRGLVHSAAYSMTEVLGPAVIAYADATLAVEVVPPLLRGDETWCQGFSEPEAGKRPRVAANDGRQGWRRLGAARAEALDELGPPRLPVCRVGAHGGPRNGLSRDQPRSSWTWTAPALTCTRSTRWPASTSSVRPSSTRSASPLTECLAPREKVGRSRSTSSPANADRSSGSGRVGSSTTSERSRP